MAARGCPWLQIKRCDEMARQLRFFTTEVEKAGILVAPRLSAEMVSCRCLCLQQVGVTGPGEGPCRRYQASKLADSFYNKGGTKQAGRQFPQRWEEGLVAGRGELAAACPSVCIQLEWTGWQAQHSAAMCGKRVSAW